MDMSGRNNPAWVERASYYVNDDGHECWRDNYADAHVAVHRLAAVAWFGYDAVVDADVVHHKNGHPRDNRESNLELKGWAEHSRDHQLDTDEPWRDREVLHELYVERGMTLQEIADELECSHATVANWRDRHGLPRRDSW